MADEPTTTETTEAEAEPESEQVDHGADLASRIGYKDWETGRDEILDLQRRELEEAEAELEEETADLDEDDEEPGDDSEEEEDSEEAEDDGEAEGEEGGDDEESKEDTAEETPAARSDDTETRTVKVNGEEREVTIAQMVADYQQKEASQQLMQQARKLEASAKFVIERVQENPLAAYEQLMRNTGMSRKEAEDKALELAKSYFKPRLEADDESNERRREREELEEEKRRLAEEKQRIENARTQEQARKQQEQFEKMISSAMTSAGLNPEEGPLVREVCKVMLDALEAGSPLKAEEAAKVVAEKRDKAIAELAETLPPDEFARRFPAYQKKVAKQHIEAAKKRRRPRSTPSEGRARRQREPSDLNDFFEGLHQKVVASR